MSIGEALVDFKVNAMTFGWITRYRPEKAGRVTLNKDLDQKSDSEKAGKGHDKPYHPGVHRIYN